MAARGILYLLIFQQLGQLVRWTWGFNVLLAPAETYKDDDAGTNDSIERGEYERETDRLLPSSEHYSDYASGSVTPDHGDYTDSVSSCSSDADSALDRDLPFPVPDPTAQTNGTAAGKWKQNVVEPAADFPIGFRVKKDTIPKGPKGWVIRGERGIVRSFHAAVDGIRRGAQRTFCALPNWLQTTLSKTHRWTSRFLRGCWEFMNPPLWAMLAAIIVASIPRLQHLFFDPGTFLSNSVTRAISQSGAVAVPLILVVLGANLARNTLPKEDVHSVEDSKLESRLVVASLISRMLIPTILMAPLLAITAKYVPVSILDDPIFVIVCFLLTGAPSALQLAQICQINNVYMGAMSSLLFQSYVVWILPSTLILVMLALETVEWAT